MASLMGSRPMFSICIPNYNYGRYIAQTIRSVLDQSFQDFEIIVVDNASTDDSVEQVERIGSKKVRLFKNRYNIGFAPNLQRATEPATGRFMNLLSSDDQMNPGALETYARVIEESGADPDALFMASEVDIFGEDDSVLRIERMVADKKYADESVPPDFDGGRAPLYSMFDGKDVLRERLRALKRFGSFCTVTYSRALWEQVEGYNAVRSISPDRHFGYKVLSLGPTVAYVNRPLFRYRDAMSDNRAALETTIRAPIDDYLDVLEFGRPEFLQPLGLRRREVVDAFLTATLREGLVQIGRGNAKLGRQLLSYAFATFPREAIVHGATPGLAALVATGPFARVVGPAFRGVYLRNRDRRRSRS